MEFNFILDGAHIVLMYNVHPSVMADQGISLYGDKLCRGERYCLQGGDPLSRNLCFPRVLLIARKFNHRIGRGRDVD
jgi:hypothetical protein